MSMPHFDMSGRVAMSTSVTYSDRAYTLRVLVVGPGDGRNHATGYPGAPKQGTAFFFEDRENGLLVSDVARYESWLKKQGVA